MSIVMLQFARSMKNSFLLPRLVLNMANPVEVIVTEAGLMSIERI